MDICLVKSPLVEMTRRVARGFADRARLAAPRLRNARRVRYALVCADDDDDDDKQFIVIRRRETTDAIAFRA